GARKAKALYDGLGLESLDALEKACREGRLEELKGFGAKTAANILKGIALVRVSAGSFHIHTARRKAEEVLAALAATKLAPGACGGARRRSGTSTCWRSRESPRPWPGRFASCPE